MEKKMKKLTLAVPFVLVALASAACGGNDKPPQTPASDPAPAATDTQATTATPKNMAVNVDDDIVKACNLKFENIEEAPKFDYDSEALTQGEKNVLEAIAKCLTTGPLKGRSVELVGRADPRGETEYNMTLGAKRARQVHSFLAQLGVPADKMRETSKGELEATGKDEEGWRKDRRVDVRLIK
ncbi:18K peptidoglycan-associated outer membrane lipoprotein [Labilithrix luteola]|uniref:18K peptidoglycan-associated outer membrane lipoprotein n=1 Tax=Labilithrix luteola TaxID=1391654 RepID=A0A0K1PU78_9BACT|nr:OmpA family protein [Labilithrix luteola]AKU96921.1 18K peptidoglycan-associated outer membrane lipoprotein [Labilithrix luteola]